MTANGDHYTYRVSWSEEDKEFIGTCLEFPSISWLARSRSDALVGACNLVADIIKDMTEHGEQPPDPLADHVYSGRFNVRISPDLHRELTIKAADRGMSLNRFISDRLAHS